MSAKGARALALLLATALLLCGCAENAGGASTASESGSAESVASFLIEESSKASQDESSEASQVESSEASQDESSRFDDPSHGITSSDDISSGESEDMKLMYVIYACRSSGASARGYGIGDTVTVKGESDDEYILDDGSTVEKRFLSAERFTPDTRMKTVRIETDDFSSINTTEYSDATVTIDGTEITNAAAKIRGRGHSTWKWDKKPLKIKFDEKQSVLGMSKAREWTLLANYADKSLIRNYVAHEMSKTLDGIRYTFSQIPVILYVNGEYMGIYTVGERIECKKNRVDLIKSDSADTGFIIEVGGESNPPSINTFGAGYIKTCQVVSPDSDKATNEQIAFIKNYIESVNDAIVFDSGYEDLIDVKSFADWIILHELTYNLDSCMRRSCFMYKDSGGKLCMGPIWDFDLAFGNFIVDNRHYDDWATVGVNENDILGRSALGEITPESYEADSSKNYIIPNWFNFLLSDREFVAVLKARWNEIGDTLKASAVTAIEEAADLIGNAYVQNFIKWDILGDRCALESRKCAEIDTFEKQIAYLNEFIENRYEWIDNNIDSL